MGKFVLILAFCLLVVTCLCDIPDDTGSFTQQQHVTQNTFGLFGVTVTDDGNVSNASAPARGHDTGLLQGNINITLGDTRFSLCPSSSCQGRCSASNVSVSESCQCDELCLLGGDCCIDYFLQCRNISDLGEAANIIAVTINETLKGETLEELSLAHFVKEHGECTYLGERHYIVVTSCPANFSDDTVKRNCGNATLTSPVSHRQNAAFIFRNIHCAECHGIHTDQTLQWKAYLQCYGVGSKPNYSVADIIKAFQKGLCFEIHKPPESINPLRSCSPLIKDVCSSVRIHSPDTTSPCNHSCTEEDLLLCRAHRLPLTAQTYNQSVLLNNNECPTFFRIFNNPHCLKCISGYSPEVFTDMSCSCSGASPGISSDLPPENLARKHDGILALFDLSQDGSGVKVNGQLVPWPGFYCPKDEVYDYISNICRKLVCSPGLVLREGECIHGDSMVDGDTQLFPKGSTDMFFRLLLADSYNCRSILNTVVADLSAEFETSASDEWDLSGSETVDRSMRLDPEDGLVDFIVQSRRYFRRFSSISGLACSNDAEMNIYINKSVETDFTELYTSFLQTLHFALPNLRDVVGSVTLSNAEEFHDNTTMCPDGNQPSVQTHAKVTEKEGKLYVVSTSHLYQQLYPLENVAFKVKLSCPGTESKEYEEGGNGKSTEKEERETDGRKERNFKTDDVRESGNENTEEDEERENDGQREMISDIVKGGWKTVDKVVTAMLCERVMSNSSLNCPANAYFRNETQEENGNLEILATGMVFGHDEYEVREDEVLVCSRFKNLNDLWGKVNFFAFTSGQRYVILTLSVVSVLSLVLVLVAYCLLPELRTLPGKIILCLVASLLIGHVALHIDVPNKNVCRLVAALSHFIWLTAFAWMSAMAVHMADTFFAPLANQKTRYQADRAFRKYSLACWGLPLAVVVTCSVLDAIPSVDIKVDYGRKLCSWIGNAKASLWVFFLPVALTLVVNLLAFLAAVFGIERTTRAARAASSRRSEGQRLLVYVKMSAALGFTWGVGLCVAFVKWAWLLWVYAVLNSLQGTFIALAFLANERVLRMLQKKLAGERKMKKSKEFLSTISESQLNSQSFSTTSLPSGRI